MNYQKMVPKLEKADSNISCETKEVIVYKDSSVTQKLFYILGGFLLGFLAASLLNKLSIFGKRDSGEIPLFNHIKSSKSDKELLNTLLPYATKTDKMRELIKKLEENIYSGTSHEIDKKNLLNNLEDFLVSKVDDRDILK